MLARDVVQITFDVLDVDFLISLKHEIEFLQKFYFLLGIIIYYWSERSACAGRTALQMGCVANVVATKFVVFSLSLRLITFLPEGVVLGS
jgi:hypothetical protein